MESSGEVITVIMAATHIRMLLSLTIVFIGSNWPLEGFHLTFCVTIYMIVTWYEIIRRELEQR